MESPVEDKNMNKIDGLCKELLKPSMEQNLDIRDLLLIFEVGYTALISKVDGIVIVGNVPEGKLFRYVFEGSISSYWPLLALAWLDERNEYIEPEVLEYIRHSLQQKWASQDYKNKAKKLLKKWMIEPKLK